jgi:hypothetical protein
MEFTKQEQEYIYNIFSQLNFKPGQLMKMSIAEQIMAKIQANLKEETEKEEK